MKTDMITLKLEDNFLKKVDKYVKNNNYHNRTEFIRDAMRDKLKNLETNELIKEFIKYKGNAKRKVSDAELKSNKKKVSDEFLKELENKFS